MQWTVNPPSSGTTGSIPVQPTKQFRGKCYGSTADSKPAGRGSIPWPWANIGSKVFMDAHEPVTLEEGDRYPLAPPSLQIMDRTGIYWCLTPVVAEVRVLWSALSLEETCIRAQS